MFRNNVRKAAARAFAVYIGWDIVAILLTVPRAMFSSISIPQMVQGQGQYILTDSAYAQLLFIAVLFVLGIVVSLCVFFITLMRIHRKEKKYLEAADADQ